MAESEKLQRAKELAKKMQDELNQFVRKSEAICSISNQIYQETGLRLGGLRVIVVLKESEEISQQAKARYTRLWDALNRAMLLDKTAGEIVKEMAEDGFDADFEPDVRVWKVEKEVSQLLLEGTKDFNLNFTKEDRDAFRGVLRFDEPPA